MTRNFLILSLLAVLSSPSHAQTISKIGLRQSQPELMRNHLKLGGKNASGESVAFTNLYMEQNGHPVVPVRGEFHYVRTPEAEWDQSLKKIKAAGVNIVSTYVFWNVHEETEGKTARKHS